MSRSLKTRVSWSAVTIVVFAILATILTVVMLSTAPADAIPASPTDESKVPHYFGPYPNWANSPLTVADASVAITGDGFGATAAATVGGNGAITGISVINPGSGYSYANVVITGSGIGASANAVVSPTSVVTSIAITANGAVTGTR